MRTIVVNDLVVRVARHGERVVCLRLWGRKLAVRDLMCQRWFSALACGQKKCDKWLEFLWNNYKYLPVINLQIILFKHVRTYVCRNVRKLWNIWKVLANSSRRILFPRHACRRRATRVTTSLLPLGPLTIVIVGKAMFQAHFHATSWADITIRGSQLFMTPRYLMRIFWNFGSNYKKHFEHEWILNEIFWL